MPYPRDADYVGAKGGLFDLSEDAKKLMGGNPSACSAFIYLFRRFGYPKFGWDGLKHLIQYQISTPMEGVALIVEPAVAGGGTFGYMLREDIDQACMDEDHKPWKDRPDDSIMKQVHTALCAAITDLLRPVYVRDVMLNISGFVGWNATTNDDDAIKYAPGSGCGVGDRLEVRDP